MNHLSNSPAYESYSTKPYWNVGINFKANIALIEVPCSLVNYVKCCFNEMGHPDSKNLINPGCQDKSWLSNSLSTQIKLREISKKTLGNTALVRSPMSTASSFGQLCEMLQNSLTYLVLWSYSLFAIFGKIQKI